MSETTFHTYKFCFLVVLLRLCLTNINGFAFHEHQIHGKPLLKVTPVDPCVQKGSTLKLTCSIIDLPDPSQSTTTHSHLPTFFNSSDLIFSSKNITYKGPPYITIVNSTSIHLTIHNFTFDLGGLYLCKINEYFVKNGVDSKQFVHVARKPLRPHSVQCNVTKLSFLTCTWQPSLEEQAAYTKSMGTFSQTIEVSVERSPNMVVNRRQNSTIESYDYLYQYGQYKTKESRFRVKLHSFYSKEDYKNIQKRHMAIYQSIIKSKGNFAINERFKNKKITSKSGRSAERMFAMRNFRKKLKRESTLEENESHKNKNLVEKHLKNNKVFNYTHPRTIRYINKRLCVVVRATNIFNEVFSSQSYCFNTDDLILAEEIEAFEFDIQKPLSLSQTSSSPSSSGSLSPFDLVSFSSSSPSSSTSFFSPSIFSLFSPSYIGPILYWQVPPSDIYSEVSFKYIINIQSDQLKNLRILSTFDSNYLQYPFMPYLNYSVSIKAVPVTQNFTHSKLTDTSTSNMKGNTGKSNLLSGRDVDNREVLRGDGGKSFRFQVPSTIPCKSPFFDAFSLFYDPINKVASLYWQPIEERYSCGRNLQYEVVMFTNTYQKSLLNAIKRSKINEKVKETLVENNSSAKNNYKPSVVHGMDCYYNHFYYDFLYNSSNQFNSSNNIHREKQNNFNGKNNSQNEHSKSDDFVKNIISLGIVPGSKSKSQFALNAFKLCRHHICILSVLSKNNIGYSSFKVSTIYIKNPFKLEKYEKSTGNLINEAGPSKLNIKNNTLGSNLKKGNHKTLELNIVDNINASLSSNMKQIEENKEKDDDDLDGHMKYIDFTVVKATELGPIVVEKSQNQVLVTTSLRNKKDQKGNGLESGVEKKIDVVLYWCSKVVYGACESVLNWQKLEEWRNVGIHDQQNSVRKQNISETSKKKRFKKSLDKTSLKTFEKIIGIQDTWSIGVGLFEEGLCEHPTWLKHIYRLGGELKPPSIITIKELKSTQKNQPLNYNSLAAEINKRNIPNKSDKTSTVNTNDGEEGRSLKVCWIYHQSTCFNCSYSHSLLLEYCTKKHGTELNCQETTGVKSMVAVDEKCHTLVGNFDEKKEYIFWMRSVDIKGRKSVKSQKTIYRASQVPSHLTSYILLIVLVAIVLLIVSYTAFKLCRRVKVYKEKIMGIEIPQNRYTVGYKSSLNPTYEYASSKVSETEPLDAKRETVAEYVDKNNFIPKDQDFVDEAERKNLLHTLSAYEKVADKMKRKKKETSGEKNNGKDNDVTNNVVDYNAVLNNDNSFMLGAYVKVQANNVKNNKTQNLNDSYIINNNNIANLNKNLCKKNSVYVTKEQGNERFFDSHKNQDVNNYLKFSEVLADRAYNCHSDDDASTYCDSSLLRDESFFNDNFKSHNLVCQSDVDNKNYYKALNKSDESYDCCYESDCQKYDTSKGKTNDFNKMKFHNKTRDPDENLFNGSNSITSPYIQAKTQIVFNENPSNNHSKIHNNIIKGNDTNNSNIIITKKLSNGSLNKKERIDNTNEKFHVDKGNLRKEKTEDQKDTFYLSLTPLIKENNVGDKIDNINGFRKNFSMFEKNGNLLVIKEKNSNPLKNQKAEGLKESRDGSNSIKALKQSKRQLPLQNHFLQHPQLINQPKNILEPQTLSLHSQPTTELHQNYIIPCKTTNSTTSQTPQQPTQMQQIESGNSVLSPYVTLSSKELFPSLNHSDSETNDDLSDTDLNII